MSEFKRLIICAAAAIALIYLVGPSAVWRITKAVGEWLAFILLLIGACREISISPMGKSRRIDYTKPQWISWQTRGLGHR